MASLSSSKFLSVLPLRLTKPDQNMVGMVGSWMDTSPIAAAASLSSVNCQDDLVTIDRLRREIGQGLGESIDANDRYENGLQILEQLQKYYHYLLECEENGIVPSSVVASVPHNVFELEWESALLIGTVQKSNSIECERMNIIWNFAVLEAYEACKQPLKTKPSWNKASKRLQNAASWLQQILQLLHGVPKRQQQQQVNNNEDKRQRQRQHNDNFCCGYPDFSISFVRMWQALLLAQAQQCIYESLLCVKRPMHVLAAKLAAAAVPLYNEVKVIAETIIDRNNTVILPPTLSSSSATTTTTTTTNNNNNSNDNNNFRNGELDLNNLALYSDLVATWSVFSRAWGIYMNCKAEYHQSQIDRDKRLWGQEIARLDKAYQYADVCKTVCEGTALGIGEIAAAAASPALDKLRTTVDGFINLLRTRIELADKENNEEHMQPVPRRQELTEIRGENLVKIEKYISKLLPLKTTESIFQNKTIVFVMTAQNDDDEGAKEQQNTTTTNRIEPSSSLSPSSSRPYQKKPAPVPSRPNIQTFVKAFKSEMNEIIMQISTATAEQTESGTRSLAAFHLPHSLTAYKQEQSGGGIPDDLWHHVHVIQNEDRIVRVKQDFWELRDSVDLTREIFQTMVSQLNFDIESDREFRRINPNFKGHNGEDFQRTFRQELAKYEKLLSTAHKGDMSLFERSEQLDNEPKYKLLGFSRSQLDSLLPSATGKPNSNSVVETRNLNYLLNELTVLFQERDELVIRIREEFELYDIKRLLQSRVDPESGTDQDYLDALVFARKAFDSMLYEIQNNMDRQKKLLNAILVENEQFMMNRERTSAASQSADSCIAMITDAIEEIKQLSNHLLEGREFYEHLIPKLKKLKQQVDDHSARITVERLEYDDRISQANQEMKDALMAKSLFSESNDSGVGDGDRTGGNGDVNGSQQSHPITNDSSASYHGHNNETDRKATARRQTIANNDVENENVSSSSTTPSPTPSPPDVIAQLTSMGFEEQRVKEALQASDNNIERAANLLLMGSQ